jgi:TolA-binding protein
MVLSMGNALLAGDQAAKAVARFEALRQDYPATEAWYNARRPLVEAYHQLKRDADAGKLLDEVATARPEMFVVADAVHLQAQLLEDQEQWPQAVAALKGLADRYPDTFVAIQARFREAALRRKHQDLDGALAVLGEVRDRLTSPYWRVQTLSLLLTLQREKPDLDAAEDTALALAELTAGTTVAADALFEAAQVQAQADRTTAARATLEKILQLYQGPPFVPLAQSMLADLKNPGQ